MTASMLFGPCSSKSRLFGPEALLKTPSVRAGVPLQDELGGRELAIVSAAEVAAAIWPGDSVDVPLMLAYTASFVHRLYMNASMLDWKPRVSSGLPSLQPPYKVTVLTPPLRRTAGRRPRLPDSGGKSARQGGIHRTSRSMCVQPAGA